MKLLKTPRFRAYLGLAVLAAGLAGLAVSGDLLVHAARFTAFYVLAGAGFALAGLGADGPDAARAPSSPPSSSA